MISPRTLILPAFAIVSLAACAAPVEETTAVSVVETASEKTLTPMVTVKPGAAVSLSSTLPKDMQPGKFGAINLAFTEKYQDGDLNIRVVPSAGLEVFGNQTVQTFDMRTSSPEATFVAPQNHEMNVDVRADTAGVYFLNVFAEAPDGQARAFSVRVNIGEVTQKMIDESMTPNGTLSEDGSVRVLEAQETIK